MIENKNPYIIAVDFDGTLCENAWPEIGSPNVAMINYLKRKQAGGALRMSTLMIAIG